MQVAILAGGLATRLGDLTRNQPKSTLKFRITNGFVGGKENRQSIAIAKKV